METQNRKTRIFIWVAHPKAGTLSESIANAYQKGAEQAGSEVRRMNLSDMVFDSYFTGYQKPSQNLEEDLVSWQNNIIWADHILFVYPYWWGAMPARTKAVLDKAILPGFAFKYHKQGIGWDKLLKGRTGDAIITSDTPTIIDTLIYRKPARNVIKNQVYSFCGIKPNKILQFGSVKLAKPKKIKKWLDHSEKLGSKASVYKPKIHNRKVNTVIKGASACIKGASA